MRRDKETERMPSRRRGHSPCYTHNTSDPGRKRGIYMTQTDITVSEVERQPCMRSGHTLIAHSTYVPGMKRQKRG